MSGQVKARESNFELLRIIAILMVLFGHVNGVAFPAMTHADVQSSPGICFSRMLFGQFCTIAVNVFILISGYFGIKPKLKSALNFAYMVLFWRSATYFLQVYTGDIFVSVDTIVLGFNPFKIWFIRDYITLMIFAPILNAFSESQPKDRFLKYLVYYYIIAFVADFIVPLKHWGLFSAGYSFFGFVGVYLLGRYIRLHGVGKLDFPARKLWQMLALLTGVAAGILFAVQYFVANPWVVGKTGCFLTYYTSPFVMLGALLFFLVFRQLSFSSPIVNHLALSAFCVYLAHSPTGYFWRCVKEVFAASGNFGWIAVGVFALLVFVGAIIVDQVRIYSWRGLCKLFAKK